MRNNFIRGNVCSKQNCRGRIVKTLLPQSSGLEISISMSPGGSALPPF